MGKENVSAAKPKTGGAIHVAPKGTQLPTDATSALDQAFKQLGYCSEDGLTNSDGLTRNETKAWGGDVVLDDVSERRETYGFTLLEASDPNVLGFVYGEENVEGTLESGITVKKNQKNLPDVVLVADMILKGGVLKRIVVPEAQVASVGEVTYNDTNAIGYAVTVNAAADSAGNSSYEYIKKGA